MQDNSSQEVLTDYYQLVINHTKITLRDDVIVNDKDSDF